jgi:hypothetical protein
MKRWAVRVRAALVAIVVVAVVVVAAVVVVVAVVVVAGGGGGGDGSGQRVRPWRSGPVSATRKYDSHYVHKEKTIDPSS